MGFTWSFAALSVLSVGLKAGGPGFDMVDDPKPATKLTKPS